MSNGSRASKVPGAKTRMASGNMPGKKAGSATQMKSFGRAKARMSGGTKSAAQKNARNAGGRGSSIKSSS